MAITEPVTKGITGGGSLVLFRAGGSFVRDKFGNLADLGAEQTRGLYEALREHFEPQQPKPANVLQDWRDHVEEQLEEFDDRIDALQGAIGAIRKATPSVTAHEELRAEVAKLKANRDADTSAIGGRIEELDDRIDALQGAINCHQHSKLEGRLAKFVEDTERRSIARVERCFERVAALEALAARAKDVLGGVL